MVLNQGAIPNIKLQQQHNTVDCNMEQLYQDNPFQRCTYTRHKNRSFTDCIESNQHGAVKEMLILRWNGRIPTIEIVLHCLRVFSAKKIKALRTKIFRYLKEHGIEAVVSIELTRGKDGKPNNTIHFHIITDDQRSEQELRDLCNTACIRGGLNSEDFRIDYRLLWNGDLYFKYFTKCGYSDRVILFQKGTGIAKFYQIGKWFNKSKKLIWENIKTYMREKYGTDPDTTDELPGELIGDNPDETSNEKVIWKSIAIDTTVVKWIPVGYCQRFSHRMPTLNVRNRRYEWRRWFGYSIAFLQ